MSGAVNSEATQAYFEKNYCNPDFWYPGNPAIEEEHLTPMGRSKLAIVRAQLADPEQEGVVYDLGAGQGKETVRYLQLGGQVVAIELTEHGSTQIEERAQDYSVSTRLSVVNADLAALDFDGLADRHGQASVVVMHGSPHYIDYTNQSRLFREAMRITKPGGIHLVSTFSTATPSPLGHSADAELYPVDEGGMIEQLYGEAGWELDVVYERNKPEGGHPIDDDAVPHYHSYVHLVARKPAAMHISPQL